MNDNDYILRLTEIKVSTALEILEKLLEVESNEYSPSIIVKLQALFDTTLSFLTEFLTLEDIK